MGCEHCRIQDETALWNITKTRPGLVDFRKEEGVLGREDCMSKGLEADEDKIRQENVRRVVHMRKR